MASDPRVFEVILTFVDFEQSTATTSYFIYADLGTDGEGAPIQTWADLESAVVDSNNKIAALSNATLQGYAIVSRDFNTRIGPVKAGNYPSCEDKAMLQFAAANGVAKILKVPAPKDEIFLADQETVDQTAGVVNALVIAATTELFTPSRWVSNQGSHLQEYDYGSRTRGRGKSEKPGRQHAIG